MKYTSGFAHIVVVILISVMAAGLVGAAWYYEENKGEIIDTTSTVNNMSIQTNTDSTITNTTNVNIASINSYILPREENIPYLTYSDNGDVNLLYVATGRSFALFQSSLYDIGTFDISKDGNYLVFTDSTGGSENVIHVYNLVTSEDTAFPSQEYARFENVLISPDNTKVAYVKKLLDPDENKYLDQAVYVSDTDGTNETKIADTGLTEDQIRGYYGDGPCEWSNDSNLIGLGRWSPKSDYVIFFINNNYECSGPIHFGIKITDLNGNESFFEQYFPDVGTFIFDEGGENEKEYEWVSSRILWPTFGQDNKQFMLFQSAPVPIGYYQTVLVDDGIIQTVLHHRHPDDTDYDRQVQIVRSGYHYAFDTIAWDERIHYSGSRARELGSNEVIKWRTEKGSDNQLQMVEESFAYTDPIIFSNNYIVYRKYAVTTMTSEGGYEYHTKADTYDLILRDLSTDTDSIVVQGVAHSQYHMHFPEASNRTLE